jgi:phenylpropionate dioxygenase-like ring-hydroxylating dioxygenase large terminal subunit
MFVRNCWYVAAWDYELESGAVISRQIIGEAVVIYRTSAGETIAMEDRCCHRSAPLSKGRIEGDAIRCMYHGFKFNREGICIEIPGQVAIPRAARVRNYPVVERYNWIWVWMGDPAFADERLIPEGFGLAETGWLTRSGQLDYQVNYELLNDNLTDFTHLTYVHAKSFRAPPEFALTRPHIERLDRGLRIWRWMDTRAKPEGIEEKRPMPAEVDTWLQYDYLAPGIFTMHTWVFPKGTADRFERKTPDRTIVPPLAQRFTSQAVTPMTATETRYYFSVGTPVAHGAEELVEQMHRVTQMAFAEDKDMIEAQQRVIARQPDRPNVLTSSDRGPVQMRAVLERLISMEKRSPDTIELTTVSPRA